MTAWLLVLAAVVSRPYHPMPIAQAAKSTATHVEARGTVTLVKHEADGDIHLRISDGKAFVVAEIVPTLKPPTPFVVPKVGDCVIVRGIRRVDAAPGHRGWTEVHPVEAIQPCR